MSNENSFLGHQGSVPETILTEADYSCLQEPGDNTWESAWIDIGGEG